MAPHSSTLAWKIPWTEEPGGLRSMGSLGVGHDWATSLSLFAFMHWRRKWQPTPVFLPGEFHGQRNLVGYSPWDHKELDITEWLSTHLKSQDIWNLINFKMTRVRQGYLLSLCLFNLYAEYIMRNAGLDELQDGMKTDRRNINSLRYVDDTTLMA